MKDSLQSLTGRVAVVTGSDSGIGAAVARAFAAAGADVAVSYLHDAAGADGTRTDVEAVARRAGENLSYPVRADVRL